MNCIEVAIPNAGFNLEREQDRPCEKIYEPKLNGTPSWSRTSFLTPLGACRRETSYDIMEHVVAFVVMDSDVVCTRRNLPGIYLSI
jgi:hypothetical protein